jgi:type II restriction enzyme
MNLQCRTELASNYKSGAQIARVLTEDWAARELYCPACDSDRLSSSRVNTPAIDFECPRCTQLFQLKSQKNWNPRKLVDAGYDAMIRSIRADRVPNLFVLQYSSNWSVRNLLLIPRVFFSESAIEKRKPLVLGARRAGWVGCNILLSRIAADGKIAMISDGAPVAEQKVRNEFSRIRKLAEVPPSVRGWTLDVLSVVRRLGKSRFALGDIYDFEAELQNAHPLNRNVRPKIRQQLQVLRDLGLIEFATRGTYRIREQGGPVC